MSLLIGRNIKAYRKNLNLTQDQLAQSLGLSVAAISKWETGAAYPDITLLPALARLFEVSVDELLGYEAQLSEQQVQALASQCAADLESLPFPDALAHCESRLQEYPSNRLLKLRIGHTYMMHLSCAGSAAAAAELTSRTVALFEAATDSGDPQVRDAARHSLGACYLSQDRYEDALRVLQAIPAPGADPDRMLVSVYYAMGDNGQARQMAQHLLANHYTACDVALTILAKIARREENLPLAQELITVHLQLSHLLGRDRLYGQDQNQYLFLAEIQAAQGHVDETLAALREYVRCARLPYPPDDRLINPFLDAVEWAEPAFSRSYLNQCARQAVAENPAFESLHENPAFAAILAELGELGV